MKERDPVSFLKFSDWINKNEHRDKDWIVVGRFQRGRDEDFATFSALIDNEPGKIAGVLKNKKWEVRVAEFGKPYLAPCLESNGVCFYFGTQEVINQVTFETFTIYRDFQGRYPSKIDIIQNFILYYNLYFNSKEKIYVDPQRGASVVKYINDLFVKVKTNYLKDYLRARDLALIRFHDHHRFVPGSLNEILGKEQEKIEVIEEDKALFVSISNAVVSGANGAYQKVIFSRLMGKDIIYP